MQTPLTMEIILLQPMFLCPHHVTAQQPLNESPTGLLFLGVTGKIPGNGFIFLG